jgi:enoyl-CoA hydratase
MSSTTATLAFSPDGLATLTLVPGVAGKPPALDHASLRELDARLAELERRAAEVRVLVVASGVEKYFCVGANITALRENDAHNIGDWVRAGHRVFNRLEDLPFPTIARVTGFALGGGLELAMSCDLIYAAASAKLGQTEAKLGVVSGWGGAWRLPRRVGLARAKELFFTGRVVEAHAALALGLVDHVEPTVAELDVRVTAFVAEVASCAVGAVAQQKAILALCAETARAASAEAEASASALVLAQPETKARLTAFLNRGK